MIITTGEIIGAGVILILIFIILVWGIKELRWKKQKN
jgi:hypothetical protein